MNDLMKPRSKNHDTIAVCSLLLGLSQGQPLASGLIGSIMQYRHLRLAGQRPPNRLKLSHAGTAHGLSRVRWLVVLGCLVLVGCGSDEEDAVVALKGLGVGMGLDEDGSVVEIDFSGSRATDDDVAHLKRLPKLTIIYISTAMGDGGMSHLEGLTGLISIDCTFNTKITDKGVAHLAGLVNLEDLSLADTQVTDEGLKYLSGMKKLKGLSLPDTKITDAGLRHLQGLTKLETLGLSITLVTDDGLPHVAALTNLTGLTLATTAITDDGLQHLATLKKLQRLDVTKIAVTHDAVVKLNKTLPRCQIAFR
jgi:Leucine-rich repeat (LRR) protein